MTKETDIKIFDQKQIRSVWREADEKWYFSIVDIIDGFDFNNVGQEEFFSTPVDSEILKDNELSTPGLSQNMVEIELSTPVPFENIGEIELSAPVNDPLVHQLPENLQHEIRQLSVRVSNPAVIEEIILKICRIRPYKLSEISGILGKSDKYILRNFVTPMRDAGFLEYFIPDMLNHPEQAYKTTSFKSGEAE